MMRLKLNQKPFQKGKQEVDFCKFFFLIVSVTVMINAV